MYSSVANMLMYPYYYGTLPLRRWANARRNAARQAPVVVLFYHRVADEHPSSWTISRRQFARQIEWLRRRYRLVSLAEAQQCIDSGHNESPVFSITFDDGYGDNSAFALPYLVRLRIPFTYFVSVHQVQYGDPFAHDVAAGQAHRTNTLDELRRLPRKGVEIGLHTRTHLNLGPVRDPERLHDEVVVAGRDLANLVDCPIRYFAFPFGLHANLNATVFQLAREAGYLGVCSAYGGYNLPGDDSFHIQRCHGDEEWMRWKNTVTIDPRKIRNTARYEYRNVPVLPLPQPLSADEGMGADEGFDAANTGCVPPPEPLADAGRSLAAVGVGGDGREAGEL